MGASFEFFGILYTLALGSLLTVSFVWASLSWRRSSIKLPHPPGPPEKGFLSGNLRDIPPAEAWLSYVEWGKKYGTFVLHDWQASSTLTLSRLHSIHRRYHTLPCLRQTHRRP